MPVGFLSAIFRMPQKVVSWLPDSGWNPQDFGLIFQEFVFAQGEGTGKGLADSGCNSFLEYGQK